VYGGGQSENHTEAAHQSAIQESWVAFRHSVALVGFERGGSSGSHEVSQECLHVLTFTTLQKSLWCIVNRGLVGYLQDILRVSQPILKSLLVFKFIG